MMSYTAARHVDGLTGIDVEGRIYLDETMTMDVVDLTKESEQIERCTRISITSSRNYNHPANLDVLEG
jgi:hypothetical protein